MDATEFKFTPSTLTAKSGEVTFDLKNSGAVLSLLAISFEPKEAPGGDILLVFADGGAIRLEVEVIEAELQDLGPVWQARSKPQHPDDQAKG